MRVLHTIRYYTGVFFMGKVGEWLFTAFGFDP